MILFEGVARAANQLVSGVLLDTAVVAKLLAFSTACRTSERAAVTPELRSENSRKRCANVAKSNSTVVNTCFDGRKVCLSPPFQAA